MRTEDCLLNRELSKYLVLSVVIICNNLFKIIGQEIYSEECVTVATQQSLTICQLFDNFMATQMQELYEVELSNSTSLF